MSSEPIDIEIRDKVADSVRAKILNIATASLEAWNNVNKLQGALSGLNISKLNQATNNAATSQQKLAQATAQAARAATLAQTAQQGLARATAQAATAQNQAAASALRLQQAQARAAAGASGFQQSFFGFARSLAALTGAGFGARELIALGDAYTTLQNKLQNVATSQEQVNLLTNRLFDLANKTRSPVEETATAFVRFDRSLKSLGKSQEDTLRLTETVNKALVVSGSTTQEQASALLQLSQAFNSGKLQGDEFRSVAENLPIVLDAIAKATNTPINQIKKLAHDGKITSEVLFKAFSILGPIVDKTFAKTIPTAGQAFTVLKNSITQSFGEFNKAIGFTETLAKAVLFLANNVGILSVAAITVSGALIAAFGPGVLRSIAAFNALALANPYVLLATAIAAVAAAVYTYGDALQVVKQDNITLLDVVKAVFSYIVDAGKAVAEFFGNGFRAGFEILSDLFTGFPKTAGEAFDKVLEFAKTYINTQIGLFVGGLDVIKIAFGNFPATVEYVFKSIANLAADAVEDIVKFFQGGFKSISQGLAVVSPAIAAALDAFSGTEFKLPRLELSKDAADTGEAMGKALQTALSKDYLKDGADAVLKRAANISRGRAEAALAATQGNLRGTGPNTNVPDPDKNVEKRATYLAKIYAELNKQIEAYGLLDAEKATYQKLEEIDIQLAAKKLPLLSATEKAYISRDLAIIESQKRVNAEVNKLYEETQGPIDNYNAKLEASAVLLARGKINQEQYGDAVRKAATEFRAFLDPMATFNDNIAEQNRLLGFNSKEREVQNSLLQLENQFKQQGKTLSDEQRESAKSDLEQLQARSRLVKELDSIESATVGTRDQLIARQQALNIKYSEGAISLGMYQTGLADVAVATANLNLSTGIGGFEDGVIASLGRIREGFATATKEMSDAFGTLFTSITDGFANSIGRAIVYGDSLKESLQEVARSALAELISSLVKVGIQYAINAALGNTALATATAAQVAAATVVAAAWAPAAALVSLASFGANAVPADAALISTSALSAALAQLKGFSDGGYTGGGGLADVAGVVHGQEFVTNAAATARNRPVLEAMNRGATVGNTGGNGGVVVNNYGTPQTYEQDGYDSDGRMRLIARDVLASEGPGMIASDMRQPNSRTSKAIRETHNVTRKR